MKMKLKKRQLSIILCMALSVAMALFTVGCNGKTETPDTAGADAGAAAGAQDADAAAGTEDAQDAAAGAKDPQNADAAAGTEAGTDAEAAAGAEDAQDAAAGTEDPQGTAAGSAEGGVIGTGDTVFTLTVVDPDGNETNFEVHTDKETVGDALVELGLIAGDDGEYGLFVKTVNGITADYDTDGVYWAFYVNGDYASTGVDSTTITEGDAYAFQVE